MKRKRIRLSSAAAALGRKGGKAGTGKNKKRGDTEHYRGLVLKRWAKEQGSTAGELLKRYKAPESLKAAMARAVDAFEDDEPEP